MNQIDPADPVHSQAIGKIRELLSNPKSCWITATARRDLAALGLGLHDALDAASEHLEGDNSVYLLFQKTTSRDAYVLLPCRVGSYDLYVKVQLSEAEDGLWLISSHIPQHPYKPANASADQKSPEIVISADPAKSGG